MEQRQYSNAAFGGCKRNRKVYSKILCELSLAGYSRTYEQCREKIKKLKAEYNKISDKRKETGQARYPEWEYYHAIDRVLGHKTSTQPAVVVDALEDIQVQDTQTNDELLQETEVEAPTNLDTSGSTVLSPASADVTDVSGEVATTSLGQQKSIDGIDKLSSRKRKKSKFDVTGEMLDKLIRMQEKSDKMLMELEMKRKRARLEEK